MNSNHDFNSTQEADTKPHGRRLQFSLRGLFLVTIVCAVGLSLVASFPDFFLSEGYLLLLIFGLVAYSLPSLVLCGPAWWFGRKRVSHWYKWEFLVLIVPYWVWISLLFVDSSGKGPANLWEPVLLAFASVLAPLGRIALAKTAVSPRLVAIGALLAVCALAVIVWGAVPGEWPGEHFHNILGPFE